MSSQNVVSDNGPKFTLTTFKHVFSSMDANGVNASIYAVTHAGALLWYKDLKRDGTNGPNGETGWDPRSGSQIGFGWDQFTHVFASGWGGGREVIYAIKPTGELFWYEDLKQDGTNGPYGETGWNPRSGSQIDSGWNQFTQVFSGGSGTIYGIKPTGELHCYMDELQDGTNGPNGERGWSVGSGRQVGTGWSEFTRVFTDDGHSIYAIKADGEMRYYYCGATNLVADPPWEDEDHLIGNDWNQFSHVFSGRVGVIYAIRPSGELVWYRDLDSHFSTVGKPVYDYNWDSRSGSQIGTGWLMT